NHSHHTMSRKKKDRLMLNLKEGERYKHRVAMVNEEGGWNQHEPNSGMARMFVIMLLIHVMVIGGIIIYDYVNGDDSPAQATSAVASSVATSALPPSAVNAATLDREMPIEDYATYEWRSGDSLPLVADKLGVTEEVLIRLNMLDKGAQIDQNTILRYPRRPVVKALALGVAGANGESALPPPITEAPPAAAAPAEAMPLTPLGENLSLDATLLGRLTPAPDITPGQVIHATPPAPAPKFVLPAPVPKMVEKPVAKALPVTREILTRSLVDKAPSRGTYLVKPGETLYGIANKHGVSMEALQKANNITKPELLRDGMKLAIPAK
ncbi:MAG: LysM peptidoglycan-binding domain-containing protein, partial [Prosthecobacter sp.]|nr:LysM peptidoglycan-binding domain-containing protein [Prosthecobacter sp.]